MRQALGPGALGRPRGIRWRGRWEGGSRCGTHVNPGQFISECQPRARFRALEGVCLPATECGSWTRGKYPGWLPDFFPICRELLVKLSVHRRQGKGAEKADQPRMGALSHQACAQEEDWEHPAGGVRGVPKAAIANYHKLGGLKQQKLVVLQFRRLEVQNQSGSRFGSLSFWSHIYSVLSHPALVLAGDHRPSLAWAKPLQSLLPSSHGLHLCPHKDFL